MRALFIVATTVLGAVGVAAAGPPSRSPVSRDVQGYAVAACLSRQSNPYLKEQGEGWAQTIVERAHGDPAAFRAVEQAAAATLAKTGVAVIRIDGPTTGDRALPVLT